MLQAFVITFREGLEAFLIVAISLAFLRKIGRGHLIPAVRWGIALSALMSVLAGWLFSRAANQPLWEGMLGLVAALSVATLTVHMWRTARRLTGDSEGQLQRSVGNSVRNAWIGLFLFTLFMISREGMETALLMGALIFQVRSADIIAGASAGIAVAAIVAWLWSRYGHRVNLRLFFQVTAIFLCMFAAQLSIYGFHELTEANVLPNSESLHWATEPYGPDGMYGQYLSYLLVLVPVGWLLIVTIVGPRKGDGQVAPVSR